MTNSVKNLIKDFEQLPTDDKKEAVYQILRLVPFIEVTELLDEALVAAAEDIFLELDKNEAIDDKAG